jgi:hypothetical protein
MIAVGAVVIAAAVPGVRHSLAGYYDYFVHDGPYLGSRIAKIPVVVQDDSLFASLATDANYADHRRRMPDFSQPLEEQVSAPHTPAELAAYKSFLAAQKADVAALAPGNAPRPDALALRIIERINGAYVDNAENSRQIDDGYLGTRNSRPEDFVFYLVNAQTACGTVGEAAVALLRNAGFRARLTIASDSPDRIEANHVFAEFYSEEQHHWVMADPMINYVPKVGGKYLSAFEFLRSPEAMATANQLWHQTYYTRQSVMWFDRWGPIRRQYYFTADKDAAGRLKDTL